MHKIGSTAIVASTIFIGPIAGAGLPFLAVGYDGVSSQGVLTRAVICCSSSKFGRTFIMVTGLVSGVNGGALTSARKVSGPAPPAKARGRPMD